jgi:hypothetical protein
VAERRTGAPFSPSAPDSDSGPGSSGGSYSAKVSAPRDEASVSTTSTGRPVSRRAVLPGSATVADASRITGEAPYLAHTRRSRRRTCAT